MRETTAHPAIAARAQAPAVSDCGRTDDRAASRAIDGSSRSTPPAIAAVTEATANTLLVLVMVALPGVVVMALSRSERRRHWYEYALVWLMFFTSVPLYGVALLIGGYGIVLARAWRRRWPHALQDDED